MSGSNCFFCKGSGVVDCSSCGGSGWDKDGDPCSSCDGTGESKCSSCDGTGWIEDPDPDDPDE